METGNLTLASAGKRLWPFFVVLIAFWILSTYWWLTLGTDKTFLFLYDYQYEYLDKAALFFFTHLGDGVILPCLILLFFWRKDPALAVTFIIAFVATAAVTQFGKHVLFDDYLRPPAVFQGNPKILISQPNPPREHTFPSGHATSIATGGIFFAYAMYEWRKWMPWLIGVLAVFLCYTRVMIEVHFPRDIWAGSMIGAIGGFLVLVVAYPMVKPRLQKYQRITNPKLGLVVVAMAGLLIILQFVRLIIELM